MSLGDGDLNLPYERVPDGPFYMDGSFIVCGGIGVRSAVLDDPRTPGAKLPALLFDFHQADGQHLPTIAFIVSLAEMDTFPSLIRKAARDAAAHARRGH